MVVKPGYWPSIEKLVTERLIISKEKAFPVKVYVQRKFFTDWLVVNTSCDSLKELKEAMRSIFHDQTDCIAKNLSFVFQFDLNNAPPDYNFRDGFGFSYAELTGEIDDGEIE